MALLSLLQGVCSTSRLSATKKLMCFLQGSDRGSFLSGTTQCESDTLNAPADKLLLSVLIKLGGHSTISERYMPPVPRMRLIYLLLIVQLLLVACSPIQSSDDRNFELANMTDIRESLNMNGTNSEHWNYNTIYSCNLLDKNFHKLLTKINPNFIKELQLDSQEFQFNFSAHFDSIFQVDKRSLTVSCNDIQELFINEKCLNFFLKELEDADYSSNDATVEYVIFSDSKACFGLGGQGWYYDYYMELVDSKAEVLLTQAVVE